MDRVAQIRHQLRAAGEDPAKLKRAWADARIAAKEASAEADQLARSRPRVLAEGSDDELEGLTERQKGLAREAEDLAALVRILAPRWQKLEAEQAVAGAEDAIGRLPSLLDQVDRARDAVREAEQEAQQALDSARGAWGATGTYSGLRERFPRLPADLAERIQRTRLSTEHFVLLPRHADRELGLPTDGPLSEPPQQPLDSLPPLPVGNIHAGEPTEGVVTSVRTEGVRRLSHRSAQEV